MGRARGGNLDAEARVWAERELSRRRFMERLARLGIAVGTASVAGRPPLVAQSVPKCIVVGASSFVAQTGYSISGDSANGRTLTITRTGGGFGTKPNDPRPLYWWPFEANYNPSALGRRTTNSVTWATHGSTPAGEMSSAIVAPGSTGSFRWKFGTSIKDCDFEPMFTTKLRGVGLGLTVVQRTVEQHGGHVEIRAGQERGTTVSITLLFQKADSVEKGAS